MYLTMKTFFVHDGTCIIWRVLLHRQVTVILVTIGMKAVSCRIQMHKIVGVWRINGRAGRYGVRALLFKRFRWFFIFVCWGISRRGLRFSLRFLVCRRRRCCSRFRRRILGFGAVVGRFCWTIGDRQIVWNINVRYRCPPIFEVVECVFFFFLIFSFRLVCRGGLGGRWWGRFWRTSRNRDQKIS